MRKRSPGLFAIFCVIARRLFDKKRFLPAILPREKMENDYYEGHDPGHQYAAVLAKGFKLPHIADLKRKDSAL